jgi:hypothetical protein
MADMLAKIGVWAFIVGVVIALLASFIPSMQSVITAALVVIGLIVGFLNVTDKETTPFLMASVSMMIALFTAGQAMQAMTSLGMVGTYLTNLMGSINIFIFPATIVVAMKAIYALAKDA